MRIYPKPNKKHKTEMCEKRSYDIGYNILLCSKHTPAPAPAPTTYASI